MSHAHFVFVPCLLVVLALGLPGCGGSGGAGSASLSSDATLSALVLGSGVLTPAFDPGVSVYTADVGLFGASTTVIPTAANAVATITADGSSVTSGSASQRIALATGPTPVLVVVTAPDGTTQQTYTVVITRAAAAAQEDGYRKASNAEALDSLGGSVSISGDTLVVGATGEDGNATGGEADNSEGFSGAAYVFIRTGTTWSQQAYLKASNGEAGDSFGSSVSISGDTLVVGATGESSSATGGETDNSESSAGAAYVFTRSGATWTQQAYIKASNSETSDVFGAAVSISGDTLVVGAFGEDSSATGGGVDNSESFAGAAYVFTRTGTAWTQQRFLKASNAEAGDFFGGAVAISGGTLVVGAIREASSAGGGEADNSARRAGAAYVFTHTGTTWSQQAYLKASNAGALDEFGRSVSVSGDTLVVGAGGEDSNAGAAYAFTRTGTTWSQQAYLKASNAESSGFGDSFGEAVSISGDTLVVGATGEDSSATGGEADNSENSAGAAYVFTRSGATWTQQRFLKASNVEFGDRFGSSVSISGDTVVVCARDEDSGATGGEADNSESGAGAVYVIR